jgi:hypothetical protein
MNRKMIKNILFLIPPMNEWDEKQEGADFALAVFSLWMGSPSSSDFLSAILGGP